jgi:hypothetical protein
MASWGSGQNLSIILLLAVLFGDCSGKQEIPKDILDKNQMTKLLIQVHLLEAKVGRLGLRADSAKQVYDHFQRLMLQEAGVDSVSFARSFAYYSDNPQHFKKVYNAVVDSLIERETREKLELDKADSLLNVSVDTLRQDSTKSRALPTGDVPVQRVEPSQKESKRKVNAAPVQ